MLRDTPSGYGLITILLHWATALLVFGLFGLGLYMVGLGYYDPWYQKGPPLHVSLGLTLLLAMLVRIAWRLLHWRKPEPLPEHSRRVRLGAGIVKALLYALIVTLIITGYLMTTADGRPPLWFGWLEFPVFVRLSPSAADLAGRVHELSAWAVVILAGLHGLAALGHHFVIHDRTLVRMLKSSKRP